MTKPVWQPTHPQKTRMYRFMLFVQKHYQQPFADYPSLYQWSITHPGTFWKALSEFFHIRWATPPQSIFKAGKTFMDAQWFEGARLNFAEHLLSRRDNHPAIVSILENGSRECLSYQALYEHVATCAQGLAELGIKKGSRVAAVMPNVAMTLIAMLATTSLGAVWSSCSPDFGQEALVDRLGQIEPELLWITDGHMYQGKVYSSQEKLTALCEAIPSIRHVVVCPVIQKPLTTTKIPLHTWDDIQKPAKTCHFEAVDFNHPLYILFSSGTTGKPKCIVHGTGGTLLQHYKELALHSNLDETDNLCFYTTCGWMMWNWMASALALGTTLTLYEGCPTYPRTESLLEVVSKERVSVFGTSAKFISSMEKAGVIPKNCFDVQHLRTILSTGSPLLPQHYTYVYEKLSPEVQLSSISGGTDIISCFALGNPMLPVYKGELQCRGLGMAVEVFNEQGQAVTSERGELVCTQPFPSMPIYFLNDPKRFTYHRAYFERFENCWTHGDFAELTAHGGLIIHGRSDAVLNPGGVRIGTAEIYRQIEDIPDIVDSVVIGQAWEDDVRVVLFVKLKEKAVLDEALQNTIRQRIRKNASPRHVPAVILEVTDIPKTISGKTVELAVKQVVHGETVQNLSAIANPEALEEYKDRKALQR